MGGLRANADTQAIASPDSTAGSGEPDRGSGARRRWAAVAAYLLAGAVLFTVYLRLSETYPLNSDSTNIVLTASDVLPGHLLLHSWYMSVISLYPTQPPQYALLASCLTAGTTTRPVAATLSYA